jgi:chromosome segregation ATPase
MENGPFATSLVGPNSLVIGLGDSTLKLSEYNALLDTKSANLSTKPEHLKSATFKLDGKVSVTAVCIADDRNNLYLGMSDGTLRVYQWPVLAENPPFMEIVAHNSAIVDLREAPNGAAIISAAEDCTVFVHTALKGDMLAFGGSHHAASMFMGGADNPMNSDILLVAKEDIEENLNEIQELNKRLRESEAKSEFSRRNLDLQHAEEVRKLVDAHQTALNTERDKCESIQTLMNQKISSLNEQLRMSADEHVKTASEIENRYEHKLADQFDRYDRLAEDMEALKQRCEGLLAAERADYERQLNDLRSDARQREKRMKAENKRMRDERSADENSFKEILDQQEDEYEGELKQLIAAAEAELKCERERIMKLQSALETKKTKMAQLIKKLKEVENGFNKGLQNLQHEKKEKQRLIETVNHLKKNLAEREDALAEKEKTILDLRSNTRTLENFRIVLDHRLQQLSAERGPISEHIVGLENHIRDMYEELVAEFDVKKLTSAEIENKDRKIATITQEVAILRADARAKETIISAFKRYDELRS